MKFKQIRFFHYYIYYVKERSTLTFTFTLFSSFLHLIPGNQCCGSEAGSVSGNGKMENIRILLNNNRAFITREWV